MTRTVSAYFAGFITTVCLAGCAAPQTSHLGFGSKMLPDVARSSVFAEAQRVLVELGYRLDRVDAESGVITTEPTVSGLGTSLAYERSRISSSDRQRRVVEIRIIQGSTGTGVRCRAAIERRTTEAHRMFRHDSAGTDIPSQTAIDLGASLTAKQTSVWKTVRRDRRTEQRILDAISARSTASNN